MSTSFTALLRSRASIISIVLGAAYGILARAIVGSPLISNVFAGTFGVMSLAFLFIVPLVIGAVTVGAVPAPTRAYRVFAPWLPILLMVGTAAAIGWEGAICMYIGTPVLLVMASLGGLAGGGSARHPGVRPALLAMPFLLSPLEQQLTPPVRLRETVTEIEIAAPPAAVWPLVASVDSIRPDERRSALFTLLGFPRPVSATLSGDGIGGVRIARFERGLAFIETVTEWVPDHRLAFTIDASEDSTTGEVALDEHVAIGGPYFDVMTGAYELHPVDGGRATRLVLRSTHRTSTRFNFYAGWWADRVMASIQNNIMDVHKQRAELIMSRVATGISR